MSKIPPQNPFFLKKKKYQLKPPKWVQYVSNFKNHSQTFKNHTKTTLKSL